MAIRRNEELEVDNHIAITEQTTFEGRIVAYGKIRRVLPSKAFASFTIIELSDKGEKHFYLSEVSDFKAFKNICME